MGGLRSWNIVLAQRWRRFTVSCGLDTRDKLEPLDIVVPVEIVDAFWFTGIDPIHDTENVVIDTMLLEQFEPGHDIGMGRPACRRPTKLVVQIGRAIDADPD